MSSTLDSEAAFSARAEQIGIEQWVIDKFKAKRFATFGKLAFAFTYAPQSADDTPLKNFAASVLEEEAGEDQVASIRRLFFEAHTMALTDVRHRSEATPDPAQATRKLPTAERVARQKAQQARLGGLVFNPNIPANHLVDLFVDMVETGILSYIKAEHCCSRAQEVEAVKRDPAVSTDAAGMLKLGAKLADPTCETNSELKLRAAWQRRNLAMDLAGLASFNIMESWVQHLFQQLLKDQPKGFAKVSLQQVWIVTNSFSSRPHTRLWVSCPAALVRTSPMTLSLRSSRSQARSCSICLHCLQRGVMMRRTSLQTDRQKCRRLTKEAKGLAKVLRMPALLLASFSCQKVVCRMTQTTNHFALPFRMGSASSKGHRERDVHVDFTNATSVVAFGTSRITYATTQTEYGWMAFHRIQTCQFLWKFLLAAGRSQEQPFKLDSQF